MEGPTNRTGGRRLPDAVWAAGVAGCVLTWVAAKGTLPGIGNDATSYVAIAERANDGGGLGYFLEPTLALWPPGWPAVLAVFDRVGIGAQIGGLLVNSLCVILLAALSAALMSRFTSDRRLVIVAGVIAAVGPATLSQSYFVQTETAFMALVLASFIAIFHYQDPGRTVSDRRRWFWLAVGFVWASFLMRYVGIVAIGSISLWLALDPRSGRRAVERLRRAGTFFAAANLVPAAWILRTVVASGTPFGPRDTPLRTYPDNLRDAVVSLGQFIHGYSEYKPARGLLGLASLGVLAIATACALALAWNWRARRSNRGHPTTIGDAVGSEVALVVIYAMAHTVYMVYSASTIAFDPVNTRYLNPVFIPALIGGLVLVDRGVGRAASGPAGGAPAPGARSNQLVTLGLAALVVVQVVVGVVRVSASYWHDQAQGYNSPIGVELRDSPVLDDIPDDCVLYSNLPEFGYTAGFESRRSPRERKFASSDPTDDIETLDRTLEADQVCLIWFDEDALAETGDVFETVDYQYPLTELDDRYRLEVIAEDDSITIYSLRQR